MKYGILIAIFTVTASTAAAQVSVERNEVISALQSLATYRPKDDFDLGPSRNLFSGQSLRIVWPLGRIGERSGDWSYDAESKRLSISVFADSFVNAPDNWQPIWRGYIFEDTPDVFGAPYEAQNSFGAKITVTPFTTTKYMVVQRRSSIVEFPPKEYAITLPPEEARLMVDQLEFVLQGTVTPYDGVHTLLCEDYELEPTIKHPTAMTLQQCMISAKIKAISLRRRDTGEVLVTWKY